MTEDELKTANKEMPQTKEALLKVKRELRPAVSRTAEERVGKGKVKLIMPEKGDDSMEQERNKMMNAIHPLRTASQ